MTYQEFVEERIQCDPDDREPFCPFNSPNCMGYCNAAYSGACYECEESLDEYVMKTYGYAEQMMENIMHEFNYEHGMTAEECRTATERYLNSPYEWKENTNENLA